MSNTDDVIAGLEAKGKGKTAGARGKAPEAVKKPIASVAQKVDTLPSGIKRTSF